MEQEEQPRTGEATKESIWALENAYQKTEKRTVKNLVPSTSEPWNQGTKKVPKTRC
jgi:hypothetical protein